MASSIQPDYSFETALGGVVAGVDEAGRGPWAGPVVAAAVILDTQHIPKGLNDSKKLTAAKREALYGEIIARHVAGVGLASAEEIDALNILGATKLAMKRAFQALSREAHSALVDGNQPPDLGCRVQCVVEGDAKCLSISAASILAKVTRDRMMRIIAREFPAYGFERHAGYGTKLHQEALAAHGITPYHRRSFAPIRALLSAESV